MPRKIGILTFFSLQNAGTFFQAYAVFQAIKTALPDDEVEIIDLKIRKSDSGSRGSIFFKRRYLISPTQFFYDLKRRKRNRQLAGSIRFSPSILAASVEEAVIAINSQKYDAILVGSDEVLRSSPPSDFCDGTHETLALLRNVHVPNKILMCPSVGVRAYREISREELNLAQTALSSFSMFSARDQQTLDFLSNCLNDPRVEVRRVPDPTTYLPLTLGYRSSLPSILRQIRAKGHLVGIRMPQTAGTLAVVDWLESRGFKAVALTRFSKRLRSVANHCSLMDYPEMFKEFDIVISSSFHECLFALKNGVFTIGIDFEQHRVEQDTGQSKIRDLFEQLSIQQNYLNAVGTNRDIVSFLDKLLPQNWSLHRETVQRKILQWGEEFKLYCDLVARRIKSS